MKNSADYNFPRLGGSHSNRISMACANWLRWDRSAQPGKMFFGENTQGPGVSNWTLKGGGSTFR